MVTQRGIEANPLKIKAILDMKVPTNVNKVQRVMGRVAALNHFISKAAEKILYFFKVLRKAKTFERDTSCQQAFEKLKNYLAGGQSRRTPSQHTQAVSSILFVRKGGSRCQSTMSENEHAFEAGKPDTSGQLVKCAVELSSSAGIVITSPYGEDLEFAVKFGFKASNNEAEYEIPMEEIVKADCLSKLVSAMEDCITRHITIQHLPKLRAPLNVQEISSIEDWRTPMSRWLEEGHFPPNRSFSPSPWPEEILLVAIDYFTK
ncbi:hypothetical protein Sango_2851300 [Sesamum angolense]|uniref:Uncharacterized protein n=1 Tax=Sesamum angolense TaxID=2727404 RepID=A0AAE1T6Y6_9LAMI|nr:hypothetical protein Sango_2851300 [Sesamum angolense]